MLQIIKYKDENGRTVVRVGRKVVYTTQGLVDELARYSRAELEDLLFETAITAGEVSWEFPPKKCSCGKVYSRLLASKIKIASDLLWFTCPLCQSTLVTPTKTAHKTGEER